MQASCQRSGLHCFAGAPRNEGRLKTQRRWKVAASILDPTLSIAPAPRSYGCDPVRSCKRKGGACCKAACAPGILLANMSH